LKEKELSYRVKILLGQAETLELLGSVMQKNAKTEEQKVHAKVCLRLAKVVEKLAQIIQEKEAK